MVSISFQGGEQIAHRVRQLGIVLNELLELCLPHRGEGVVFPLGPQLRGAEGGGHQAVFLQPQQQGVDGALWNGPEAVGGQLAGDLIAVGLLLGENAQNAPLQSSLEHLGWDHGRTSYLSCITKYLVTIL